MKQVRETAAGKSISAYVILRPDGTHVATVQVHRGGALSIDVWHSGEDNPTRAKRDAAKDWGPDQRRAGGGGYNRMTAALSGIEIDGHRLTDHCGESLTPPGPDGFPEGFKAPPGYSLANWRRDGGGGWSSCYREAGLRYLERLGYRVIHAI